MRLLDRNRIDLPICVTFVPLKSKNEIETQNCTSNIIDRLIKARNTAPKFDASGKNDVIE
jgi:hypothetical protein